MCGSETEVPAEGDASPPTSSDDIAARDALAAFNDDGCRQILAACRLSARTAPELCTSCHIPESTIYRKLERLTAASLVEGRPRLVKRGKPPTEYVTRVAAVEVSVGENGTVDVEPEPALDRAVRGRGVNT
ncbi:MAG: ArsR family transcriptional regulator [Salinigranum sp.]